MSTGFMDPDQAERSIWVYYWQLSQQRDRRSTPIMIEPPDQMSPEEIERLRERQLPWQRKAMLKAWEVMKKRDGRVSTAIVKGARAARSLFTAKAEQKYFEDLTLDAAYQDAADEDLTGKVDPKTGLPWTTNDLQGGRGVISGVELCMNALVPPRDLAEAFTAWLPPCPPDFPVADWGKSFDHWQALGFKPKEIQCKDCRGTGRQRTKTKRGRAQGLIRISDGGYEFRDVVCGTCKGMGMAQNWDQEEHEAVKHNAVLLARKVHELAELGYFDTRPINNNDVEMGDLVWRDDMNLTIGFRLTWEGYQRMQEFCARDPELQSHKVHVLTFAGEDVRKTAPDWAQQEFKNTAPIQISGDGGGLSGGSSGGLGL